MDVSGWTVDQRMRLPDWCFGNRKIFTCRIRIIDTPVIDWIISTDSLPDPACIWSFGMIVTENSNKYNNVRVGLRATLPTSEAEMNECVNIFPDFGNNEWAPPRYTLQTEPGQNFHIQLKQGLVTGGKKLVVEGQLQGTARLIVQVYLIVSGLPTSMAGWMAHNK